MFSLCRWMELVAVSYTHLGIYPTNYKPTLRLDVLKAIREQVNIPLVLHGGSSNPDEEITQAVALGICKINISSDVKTAFFTCLLYTSRCV